MTRNYLFSTEKYDYIKRKKDHARCILCAVRDRDTGVESLEVYRTGGFIVSLNLYPYNPGHLLIFPERHITSYGDFTDAEALKMHHLLSRAVTILREEFSPPGFNIGFNLGEAGGASILHIHQHVVPRYGNEVGFMDVLSDTRIMVIDPRTVLEKLRKRFAAPE